MKHHSTLPLAIGVSLSMALLAGCGDDSEDPDITKPAQIANPASQYCVERGGTVEIITETGGQIGYCNLADGTRVEEWEYYRSQTGVTTVP